MTDGELVARVCSGQTGAYEQLVRRWSAPVLAVCHARVRCRHAAEDLAQEALLRGLREIAALREPDRFGAWVRGIAHRVCLDWLKAKQTSQVPFAALGDGHDGLLASEAEPPERDVDLADETSRLIAEVESLPDDCREVIMLYYYNDNSVTYRDLARMLGVSTATVNARLTRARNLLRERLHESRRAT